MNDFYDDFDGDEALAKELAHSRELDVHVWSEHPEVNNFVDRIYADFFEGRKAKIVKKHLKVLLLDLYLAWIEDPNLKITVPRNVNVYKAHSRYNELHISAKTIDVVDTLKAAKLIDFQNGFYDRRNRTGRMSRIWPTDALVEQFKQALFTEFDVRYHADRKAVILRADDADKKAGKADIEFVDDDHTIAMEQMLSRYNDLLWRTFIDIPILDGKGILMGAAEQPAKRQVSLRDKFVRRIFNRRSFELGGRFYGGWWQHCPKEWRPHIFMDGKPTNELDFSGLHIVMAYALKGINYWHEVGRDPYSIEPLEFAQDNDFRRAICKSLMLVLLNAKDKKAAFKAFRSKAKDGSPEKRFKDEQLEQLYQALVRSHAPIREFFHADKGILLMNLDGQITESILSSLTAKGIPALALHDSYIVPCGYERHLKYLMKKAFKERLNIPLEIKGDLGRGVQPDAIKEAQPRLEDFENELLILMQPDDILKGAEIELEGIYFKRKNPAPSERYKERYAKHRAYHNQ